MAVEGNTTPSIPGSKPDARIPGLTDSRQATTPLVLDKSLFVVYGEVDDDTFFMRGPDVVQLLGGNDSEELGGLKVFEQVQDDEDVNLIPVGLNVVTESGRRFEAKQDLTRIGGLFPVPTGEVTDIYWKELPVGGIGYNPRVLLGQQAVLAQVNTNTLSVDKLYRIIRRRYMTEGGSGSVGIEDKPDIYAYALTGSQFAPIAYQFDNGVITAGSYDVETDTFSEIDFKGLAALNATIRLVDAGGEVHAYESAADAVAEGLLQDGLVTLNRGADASGLEIAGCSLRGQGNFLFGARLGDGPVSLALIDAFDVRIADADIIAGATYTNCTFDGGITITAPNVTANNSVFVSTVVVSGAGVLKLTGSTTVPNNFFTGFTNNGDGTYTTLDGGAVQDNRSIVPGPGGSLYRHFITTPGGEVTPNYVLI